MRSRNMALVAGAAVSAFVGVVLLSGGGLLLWAHATQRDPGGFYTTSTKFFHTPTYALTSSVDLGRKPGERDWVPFQHQATVRLRATRLDGGPVFIGIAPTADVDRYLAGAAHDRITDVRRSPFQAHYRRAAGGQPPPDPGAQPFWSARVVGAGPQTVSWETKDGRWSAVIMNADASASVSVDAAVAATVPVLLPVGVGLTVAGVLWMAGATVMLAFGMRRPGDPQPAPERGTSIPVTAS